jgi:hypothetical protein
MLLILISSQYGEDEHHQAKNQKHYAPVKINVGAERLFINLTTISYYSISGKDGAIGAEEDSDGKAKVEVHGI